EPGRVLVEQPGSRRARRPCGQHHLDVVLPVDDDPRPPRPPRRPHRDVHLASADLHPQHRRTVDRAAVGLELGYSKRFRTIEALWPPKPNEFETATRTSASRGSFG